jgi:prepilin-type N-terminal cleavage/methylation domain-containing protein
MNTKKGFTLLELLIVIGILAILSTTIVLVINPAELLKKARDSRRIFDLNTVKTAIAYYLTEEGDPSIGTSDNSYSHVSGVECATTENSTSSQAIDGTGWIPVAFSDLAGGAHISNLPIDPNASTASTGNYYYVYLPDATNLTFKLVANMESTYYSNTGDGDVESTDGGDNDDLYEVGTDMGITLTAGTNCYPEAGE